MRVCKTYILCVVLAFLMYFSAFAADDFPFGLEFDTDMVEHLCFAGHFSGAVKYKSGIMVLPDTRFSVVDKGGESLGYDIDNLSATVTLIYENEDGSGVSTETLRSYPEGALNEDEYFPFLSDNIIANLDERGLLYSDGLKSLYVTLKCPGRGSTKAVTYLYVSSDDDFYEFLDMEPDEETDEE